MGRRIYWNNDREMKQLILSLLVFVPMGCVTSTQTIEARNNTTERLTEFGIRGENGFSFRFGNLSPGIRSVHGGNNRIRLTETCEVLWLDSEGKSHSQMVDLKDHLSNLPRAYHGGLKFVLEKDGRIRVYPRKN